MIVISNDGNDHEKGIIFSCLWYLCNLMEYRTISWSAFYLFNINLNKIEMKIIKKNNQSKIVIFCTLNLYPTWNNIPNRLYSWFGRLSKPVKPKQAFVYYPSAQKIAVTWESERKKERENKFYVFLLQYTEYSTCNSYVHSCTQV